MEVLGRTAELAEESALTVPLAEGTKEPYASILAYPKPETSTVASRIRQLGELGVYALEFGGPLKLGKLSVLGKGVAGIVIVGMTANGPVAVKIRRTDSRRVSLEREASMLRVANGVEVGPRYHSNTTDVLLMDLVDGHSLPQWLPALVGRGRRLRFRLTVSSLFEQCLRLDQTGLDHGELSRAHKNVRITGNGRGVILDFESASMNRHPNNLTSLAQYFFLGKGFARRVCRIMGPVDTEALKSSLRSYKSSYSPNAFNETKKLLKLP